MFKVSRGASLDRFYLLKLFGFGVFVHRIHLSDPVCLYHSHPWSGLSLIFGGYIEIIRGKLGAPTVVQLGYRRHSITGS